MSVITEAQIQQSIQHAIKNALINTKYPDESITFAQAVVTHHFLNNQPKPNQQQSHQSSNLQQSITHNLSQGLSDSLSAPKQVVQWDLLPHPKEFQQSAQFGRKKAPFGNETRDIKDVFQWQGEDGKGYTKRRMDEIQVSPSRWITEQRNQYRYFVESPSKQNNDEKENDQQAQRLLMDHEDQLTTGRDDGKQSARINQQLSRSVRISQYPDLSAGDDTNSQKPDGKSPKGGVKKLNIRPLSSKQQKDKNMKKRLDNLNSTTRWLPDTAFQTYFGKPAFHLYGKGNTNPAVGGEVYGQYMLTHNINPESGEHLPQYQQVYDPALTKGAQKYNGVRVPTLPRKVNDEIRLTPGQVEEIQSRNPIMPKDRTIGTGGQKREKMITIQKPDLTKERYMNSKHTTPNDSIDNTKQITSVKPKGAKQNIKILDADDSKDELISKQVLDQMDDQKQHDRQHQFQEQNQQQNFISHGDLILQEGQDIGEADNHQNCTCHKQPAQANTNSQNKPHNYLAMCQIPTSQKALPNELDPKNYSFLPSCWIHRIRPAGKQTYQSENLYKVVINAPYAQQFQETI